jgi:hypothetical protein
MRRRRVVERVVIGVGCLRCTRLRCDDWAVEYREKGEVVVETGWGCSVVGYPVYVCTCRWRAWSVDDIITIAKIRIK